MGLTKSSLRHGEPSTQSLTDSTTRHKSFHEALVRERDKKESIYDIYEILDDIGQGGLCEIYKIRKRDEKIGGSSHPHLVRQHRNASWRALATAFPLVPPPPPSPQITRGKSYDASLYYALKVINLKLVAGGSERIDQLKNEVELLKTLDHKSIIKAYETFQDRETKQLMIVMELCTGGDLYARIPYAEQHVAKAVKQILSAISYMHDRSIIHRDIKMQNIMYENTHPAAAIKVIDFGLSKEYSQSESVLKERVGTLYSMSPETMQGNYTAQADLWSIGVCTYIMLSNGDKPFEGKTPKQVVAKVLLGQYNFDAPIWMEISEDAKDFIRKLLVVKPEDRMTASQAMRDPWVANTCSSHGSNHSSVDEDLVQRVREGIVEYAQRSEFRKLALNVVAKKSSAEDIFALRDVFDEFDTLNTGTITLEEFKDALAKFNYSEEDLFEIFRKVDVNKNNEINYTEFLAAALEALGTIEEYRLAEAFDLLDSDDSGFISRGNLRQIVGEDADEAYIDRLMSEANDRGDGKISYEDFLRVFSEKKHDRIYNIYEEASESHDDELEAEKVLKKFGIKSYGGPFRRFGPVRKLSRDSSDAANYSGYVRKLSRADSAASSSSSTRRSVRKPSRGDSSDAANSSGHVRKLSRGTSAASSSTSTTRLARKVSRNSSASSSKRSR